MIRRAKIELIKIVSKEYIESLKRNYLKSERASVYIDKQSSYYKYNGRVI